MTRDALHAKLTDEVIDAAVAAGTLAYGQAAEKAEAGFKYAAGCKAYNEAMRAVLLDALQPREEPHTCHDMQPPFPYPCAACAREKADAPPEPPTIACKPIDAIFKECAQQSANRPPSQEGASHRTAVEPKADAPPAPQTTELSRHDNWQPIATAPKDGRAVLLYPSHGWAEEYDRGEVAYWDNYTDGGWLFYGPTAEDYTGPTHWMPLPEPPR